MYKLIALGFILQGVAGPLGVYGVYIVGVLHRSGLAKSSTDGAVTPNTDLLEHNSCEEIHISV